MASSFDMLRKGWESHKKGQMMEAIRYYELAKKMGHNGAEFHLHCMKFYGQGIPENRYYVDWDTFILSDTERDNLLSCYEELCFLPEIQHNMGELYYTTQDYRRALQWWSLSGICNNYSHSLVSLGYFYDKGLFVKKDGLLACKYYEKAILQNNLSAMCSLGDLYYHGTIIPQDYKKAFNLYLSSANQGYSYGAYNVAVCYEYGKGVETDLDQALIWYVKCSDKNFIGVQKGLARTHKHNMALYLYWHSLAAEQGDSSAQNGLGLHYYNIKEYDTAVYWFTQSANKGDGTGQYNLGLCYHHGYGLPKDQSKAHDLWLLASQNGRISSRRELGKLYEELYQDYNSAYLWYSLAPTDNYSSDKIRYFDKLDLEISQIVRSYKQSKLQSYIEFSDLMKKIYYKLQPITISDPLIRASIIKQLIDQDNDGPQMTEWFDAMF